MAHNFASKFQEITLVRGKRFMEQSERKDRSFSAFYHAIFKNITTSRIWLTQ